MRSHASDGYEVALDDSLARSFSNGTGAMVVRRGQWRDFNKPIPNHERTIARVCESMSTLHGLIVMRGKHDGRYADRTPAEVAASLSAYLTPNDVSDAVVALEGQRLPDLARRIERIAERWRTELARVLPHFCASTWEDLVPLSGLVKQADGELWRVWKAYCEAPAALVLQSLSHTPTHKPVVVAMPAGTPLTEVGIRRAHVRTAYLENHGNVQKARRSMGKDGHPIAQSTFYEHLAALDESEPGWRNHMLSGPSGNIERGAHA